MKSFEALGFRLWALGFRRFAKSLKSAMPSIAPATRLIGGSSLALVYNQPIVVFAADAVSPSTTSFLQDENAVNACSV
jgi:hypothetical protein